MLEARGRIGGRIFSVDAQGKPSKDGSDLGPSWLWQETQPSLDSLVKDPGLATFLQNIAGERRQIKFINKQINHPNQVILANPALKTIWKNSRLLPRSAFDETRHADLPPLCPSLP